MDSKKQNGSIIAIITMMFLYAMISFVTNLAAPVGVIWKGAFDGSNTVGMLGNMMNFLAYLFMGIPAGKLLTRIGYKKTALAGIGTGFVGVLIQFISGSISGTPGFVVYLLGAFISGFCVCMLNTVVNPMLNLLGGIGDASKASFSDVNPVMYIAMAVFAAAFVVLMFVPIEDPEMGKTGADTVFEHSAWSFRHFVLGTIAIFVYVGVEVGIPGTMIFYLSDTTEAGGGLTGNAAAIAGSVAATYWLLMLVGRFGSSFFASKVSSKTMMTVTTITAMTLIVLGMLLGKSTQVSMPVFTGASFEMVTVPALHIYHVGQHLQPCNRRSW